MPGHSRSLPWARAREAASLPAVRADPDRGFDAGGMHVPPDRGRSAGYLRRVRSVVNSRWK